MTNKPFANMSPRSIPSGNEWSSVASYMFKHHEQMMLVFFDIVKYNDLTDAHALAIFHMYFIGMSTTLGMLEDNGMPSDLDEVIHDWNHEEPFDISSAIRLAQENL